MNYSQTLLTELKAAHGLNSDYMAAKVLQISHQAVSKVQTRNKQFSDETVVKIADLIGRDPIRTLAELHLETEDSHILRNVWQRILKDHDIAESLAIAGVKGGQVA